MMEERDRISELPDDILQRILSPLPIQDKIRTSVLSKRWVHLWLSNPTLDFSDCTIYFCDDTIAAAVDQCLHFSTANLKVLDLRLDIDDGDVPSISHLDEWICRADKRFLQELVLWFGDFHYSFRELPLSLFHCQWLSMLQLEGCKFQLPSSEALNFCCNLKALILINVQIISETLASILAACTFLEKLILLNLCGLTQLEISNQNQHLEQLVVGELQFNCRVVIVDAPNLQSILYIGNLLNLSFLKKAPRLTHAVFISKCETPFPFGRDCREFFLKISHIEFLSLNDPFLCVGRRKVIPREFSFHVPFMIKRIDGLLVCKGMKELHLCTYPLEQASLYSILYSLQHLTSLESFCFSLKTYKEFYDRQTKLKVSPPTYMNLPYEMPHIKTITITEFKGDYHEIQVVKFVLLKAVSLESLILHPAEGKQISEKLHEELLQISRSSTTAQVKFSQALDEDDFCPRHKASFIREIFSRQ